MARTMWNTETFKEKVIELENGDYEVLGEYVNARTKLEMKHIPCDTVYSVVPDKFLNGRRCPQCAKLKRADARRKGVRGVKNRKVRDGLGSI